jgi:hypothetical protein
MLRAVPTFDATLQYLFDHDYWIRAYDCGFRPIFIDVPLANFRLHGESKSCSRQHFQMRELWQVTRARRSSLSEADWKMIKEWVRSYEASNLLTSVYSLLATGRRASAADYLLRSMPLYGYLSPARLILGAFYRTFITGRPPKWFRQ